MTKRPPRRDKQPTSDHSENPVQTGRRRALARMLAGGTVAGAAAGLPAAWTRPVVQSVLLPAHAQTSEEQDGLSSGSTPEDGYFSGPVTETGSLLNWLVPTAHALTEICDPQTACAELADGTLTIIVAPDLCCCYQGSGSLGGGSISLTNDDTFCPCPTYTVDVVSLTGTVGSRSLELLINSASYTLNETNEPCICVAQ